jgi:COMPASS component SWD1
MNITACPELIERRLIEGHAVLSSFNRAGTLLAVGCLDGRIMIWDFEVIGVSRVLFGHTRPICTISWAPKHLLTSSLDWNVIWWDLKSGEILKKFSFDSPILFCSLHDRLPLALVSPFLEVRVSHLF